MATRRRETQPRKNRANVPPDPTGGKRALVLCGGGITGVTYEIGALRALDDLLVGVSVNDFDIYVGTSAGSWVTSLLVNGVSPTDMALGLEGSSTMLAAPSRWTIYRPNIGEMLSRLMTIPSLARDMVREVARNPSKLNPLDAIGMMLPLLPSGIFDSKKLIEYLHRALTQEGFSDDFRDIEQELHIVSCALDSGERTVFSKFTHGDVPISLAAAASSAVPILFKPVRIKGIDYVDGGIKGNSAIDVAVDRGATLIVVINPVVPLDARSNQLPQRLKSQLGGKRLVEQGARGIYNQVFRGMLHDGMLDHIRLVRDSHPDVDILLIEPRPDDEKMFFHELMSFSARLMVLQHGYESVRNGLDDTWGYLRRILPRHGVHISRRVVERRADVPVESYESTNMLERLLRQTVFARRPRIQVVESDQAV